MVISCTLLLQNANVGGYTSRGFVEILAASQSPSSSKWFQGTADAVRQYLWLFENAMRDGVEDFLILSGKQLASSCMSARTHTHSRERALKAWALDQGKDVEL